VSNELLALLVLGCFCCDLQFIKEVFAMGGCFLFDFTKLFLDASEICLNGCSMIFVGCCNAEFDSGLC